MDLSEITLTLQVLLQVLLHHGEGRVRCAAWELLVIGQLSLGFKELVTVLTAVLSFFMDVRRHGLMWVLFTLHEQQEFLPRRNVCDYSVEYLIVYLACNKVVLIVAASESDVLEPASYIWLTGIYAELHIAKLI